MRTVGVQLVEGRGALGVAEGGGQRPDRRQLVHRAGGQAAGGEALRTVVLGEALVALGVGVHAGVLQAGAEAEVEAVAELPFLQGEQRGAVGFRVRHEGFLAEGGEAAVGELRADHPVQRAERAVAGLDAAFVAFVLEGGAGLAVLDFLVLVLGIGGVQLQRGERAFEVADLGGEGVAVLLHLQAHVVLGRRAIVAVVAAVGEAGVTVLPVIGATDGAAVLAAVAVLHPMLAGVAVDLPLAAGMGVAGNPDVVELAAGGVHVQGEVAVAGLQCAGAATGGVGAAVAQFAAAVDAVDGFAGDAVVEAVHHPADGIAAVEQGGRAAYHFQALDAVGVFRHRVVVGQRRGVERTDAVAQQADAITVHAADHRSAGARSEVGGGHPGQAVEGFAEAAFLSQGQLVAFEHAAGRGGRFVAQRVGGDHLGGQFAGAAVGAERFPQTIRQASASGVRGQSGREGKRPEEDIAGSMVMGRTFSGQSEPRPFPEEGRRGRIGVFIGMLYYFFLCR